MFTFVMVAAAGQRLGKAEVQTRRHQAWQWYPKSDSSCAQDSSAFCPASYFHIACHLPHPRCLPSLHHSCGSSCGHRLNFSCHSCSRCRLSHHWHAFGGGIQSSAASTPGVILHPPHRQGHCLGVKKGAAPGGNEGQDLLLARWQRHQVPPFCM